MSLSTEYTGAIKERKESLARLIPHPSNAYNRG
jgi:hypothetical protein